MVRVIGRVVGRDDGRVRQRAIRDRPRRASEASSGARTAYDHGSHDHNSAEHRWAVGRESGDVDLRQNHRLEIMSVVNRQNPRSCAPECP